MIFGAVFYGCQRNISSTGVAENTGHTHSQENEYDHEHENGHLHDQGHEGSNGQVQGHNGDSDQEHGSSHEGGHEEHEGGHEGHEGGHEEHKGGHEGHKGGHEGHEGGHEGEIIVSVEKQRAFGIAVETVRYSDFSEVIKTSGQILSATGDEMTVVAKADGIVSLGRLTEGYAVGKGSRIASISSRNLATGDQLAKARITFETAEKEYERDLLLSKDNIVSESHLDQSRLVYEQARADFEALASGGAGADGVAVVSPLSGYIKSLNVKNGDFVTMGSPVATVSQNRKLQLRADVSEKYYGKISQITDANFTTSYSGKAYSLKELNGRLVSYGRSSAGDFHIPVTFEFDNKGEIFAGSYADVYLKTKTGANAISVPISAVVEDQGVHYVFIQNEPDAFLKKEVTLGQSDGERVLVRTGLNEGDAVVVSGAVQVKLASVTAVPAGHNHNH